LRRFCFNGILQFRDQAWQFATAMSCEESTLVLKWIDNARKG